MTAPRFALVDHGLTGSMGHNLTYARRVLAAARAQGFEVVAGVGQAGGTQDLDAETHPRFAQDVWANNPTEGRLWHAKALAHRALKGAPRTTAAQPVLAAGPSAATPLSPPGLASPGLAAPLRAPPHLASVGRGLQSDIAALLAPRRNARRFAEGLDGFIAAAGLRRGDLVYMPTVLATELEGLDLLLARSALARSLRWRVMLRYAPQSRQVRSSLASAAARLHRRPGVDVRFYSDTEELCASYLALCGTPFDVLPVPVDLDGPARSPREGPLTVGFFGDARDEKGFDLLPGIVRRSRAAEGGRPMRFLLQANLNTPEGDPLTRAALGELAGMAGPDVELVEGPLTLQAYRATFERTDVVLLPYRPDAYAERSSGVLMEAIAAGLPSLVTRGGWMEATLARAPAHAAGRVVDADAEAFHAALQEVAASWTDYAAGALALRETLRPRLDPAELVRRVAA